MGLSPAMAKQFMFPEKSRSISNAINSCPQSNASLNLTTQNIMNPETPNGSHSMYAKIQKKMVPGSQNFGQTLTSMNYHQM